MKEPITHSVTLKGALLSFKVIAACSLLLLASCGDDLKKEEARKAPDYKIQNGSQAGVVGIFDMPEMLTICVADSSDAKDIAFHMAQDYTLLEEEAAAIGAELDGKAPGVINYNGDAKNLKFECFLLIRQVPARQPTRCRVVALEAGKMLVYNHYGSYSMLHIAYDNIRRYCEAHSLKQNGPVRELYLSDATEEKDQAKLLTRIILPVEVALK